MSTTTDTIGGFPYAEYTCKGCGAPLLIANAWMVDGCPCDAELGCNSMNETRWRLLMELQRSQSCELTELKRYFKRECIEYARQDLTAFAKAIIKDIESDHHPNPFPET